MYLLIAVAAIAKCIKGTDAVLADSVHYELEDAAIQRAKIGDTVESSSSMGYLDGFKVIR